MTDRDRNGVGDEKWTRKEEGQEQKEDEGEEQQSLQQFHFEPKHVYTVGAYDQSSSSPPHFSKGQWTHYI